MIEKNLHKIFTKENTYCHSIPRATAAVISRPKCNMGFIFIYLSVHLCFAQKLINTDPEFGTYFEPGLHKGWAPVTPTQVKQSWGYWDPSKFNPRTWWWCFIIY